MRSSMERSAVTRKQRRLVIGWREWVGLPELGIENIKAKVDTGARTSTIHAWNIARDERADGLWVSFDLHPIQRDNQTVVSCCAPVVSIRDVRNSGGTAEQRFVIRTPLRIGDAVWPIDLSLTNRDEMGFRMLLGRTAVKGRAVIDPGRSFLIERDIRYSGRRVRRTWRKSNS